MAMIAEQWRERLSFSVFTKARRQKLLYIVMSLFLALHTIVMVVAPAPDTSKTAEFARSLLTPYMAFFRLDSAWDFFAPNVPRLAQFRYVVEGWDRKRYTFAPTNDLNWYHPSYIWFRDWYETTLNEPDTFGPGLVARLCKQHADLRPRSVVLYEVQEGEFMPEDQLAGKHPLDNEFATWNMVSRLRCPAP
jgi:hypothetical protein